MLWPFRKFLRQLWDRSGYHKVSGSTSTSTSKFQRRFSLTLKFQLNYFQVIKSSHSSTGSSPSLQVAALQFPDSKENFCKQPNYTLKTTYLHPFRFQPLRKCKDVSEGSGDFRFFFYFFVFCAVFFSLPLHILSTCVLQLRKTNFCVAQKVGVNLESRSVSAWEGGPDEEGV